MDGPPCQACPIHKNCLKNNVPAAHAGTPTSTHYLIVTPHEAATQAESDQLSDLCTQILRETKDAVTLITTSLVRCISKAKTVTSTNRNTCIATQLQPLIKQYKVAAIIATATAAKQLLNAKSKRPAPGLMYQGIPMVTLPDLGAYKVYPPEVVGGAIDQVTKLCKTTGTRTVKLFNKQDIEQTLALLGKPGTHPVAFDYETTSLTPWTGDVLSVALSPTYGQAIAFMMSDEVVPAWRAWLESPTRKIVHQAAFEVLWSKYKYGVAPQNLAWDTRLGARMWDENESASLKSQCLVHTDIRPYWGDALEKVKEGRSEELAPTTLLAYNGGDADATRRLCMAQWNLGGTSAAFDGMDYALRITEMLCDVRTKGVLINTAALPSTAASVAQQTEAVIAQMRELPVVKAFGSISGAELNPASPMQLSRLLYGYLSLPPLMRSRTTGAPSTSTYALNKLKARHPVVPLLLEYRRLTQITKNFLTPLSTLVSPEGVVHPSWNLGGTVTWRLSCTEPNLQNIPRDGKVRELVIPRPGNVFISADYSQIELRILAVLSDEPTLLNAFIHGQDPHVATAAKLYGIDSSEVTDEQRSNGKRLNFASVYGITATGLEQKFDIPVDEATVLLKRFWSQLPKVAEWLQMQRDDMHKYGVVVSMYGRRRRFPDRDAFSAERQAGNFPIQSAAADITLEAMYNLHNALPEDAYIVGQVHDSILVEAPEHDAATVSVLVKNVMEAAGQRFTTLLGSAAEQIPFPVDVKTGKDWFNVAHENGEDTDAEEADPSDEG